MKCDIINQNLKTGFSFALVSFAAIMRDVMQSPPLKKESFFVIFYWGGGGGAGKIIISVKLPVLIR